MYYKAQIKNTLLIWRLFLVFEDNLVTMTAVIMF